MYVLLIALVSNLSVGNKHNVGFVYSQSDIVTYQIDYKSKESCLKALNEANKPSKYLKPVYVKCLPK